MTAVSVVGRLHVLARWTSWLTTRCPRVIAARGARAQPLLDQQAACDAVFSRIERAGTWMELRHCATELRFLTVRADRLLRATSEEYGQSPEIRAAGAALDQVHQDLCEVASIRQCPGGVYPYHVRMRNVLYNAVWHLRYALLALSWVRAGKRHPRVSYG